MSEEHNFETGEILPAVSQRQQVILPMASPSCAEVWTALAVAQGKFESPKRTKEATVDGQTASGKSYSYKYKYAPLEEIERVVRAPLAENGLFRQQYLVSRGNQWFIRTMIGHTSGEWIACDYPVYVAKSGAQGFASGVTYARRYGLSLALGLAPEDDDDAQGADSAPAPAPGEPAAATAPPRRANRPVAAANPPRYEEAKAALLACQADVDSAETVDHLLHVTEGLASLQVLMKEGSPGTWEAAMERLHERIAAREKVLREDVS